jgi:hypothetical protein
MRSVSRIGKQAQAALLVAFVSVLASDAAAQVPRWTHEFTTQGEPYSDLSRVRAGRVAVMRKADSRYMTRRTVIRSGQPMCRELRICSPDRNSRSWIWMRRATRSSR